jgi:hypothetical protein
MFPDLVPHANLGNFNKSLGVSTFTKIKKINFHAKLIHKKRDFTYNRWYDPWVYSLVHVHIEDVV